jgi:CO/xanthine dehydrogenase Mo-binding subunit
MPWDRLSDRDRALLMGEIRPVAAALANAVFDATGVRLRRASLTPQRLKPTLS